MHPTCVIAPSRPENERFAVVSSGTWTVVMAHGAELERLQEGRDMLANIDAFGSPVATARFPGGREYEAIAGDNPLTRQPTLESLKGVLQKRALALPSFAGTGGPFVGQRGKLVDTEQLDARERGALATLYCALQTDLLLDLLGAPSPVIIDGPLTENPLYGPVLATLRAAQQGDLKARETRTLTRQYSPATIVPVRPNAPDSCWDTAPATPLRLATPLDLPGFEDYRARWRAEATSRPPYANPQR